MSWSARGIWLGLLAGALGLAAPALTAPAAPPQGVRVEAIGPSSTLARSELQPGDVILSWARIASTPKGSSLQGLVTSPLEVLALEREGRAVSFTAARGEDVVFVHAPPGPWHLTLVPVLPSSQARDLERSRVLARGGSHAEAGGLLRRVAGASAASRRFLVAAWLELEACRSFREAGDLPSLQKASGLARDWARRSRQPRESALVDLEVETLLVLP